MKIFGMKSAKFIPIWMKLYLTLHVQVLLVMSFLVLSCVLCCTVLLCVFCA